MKLLDISYIRFIITIIFSYENCKTIIENRGSIPVFLNNISCQLASDNATLSYEANACIRFLESAAEGDKQYFSLLIKKMEN